MGAETADSIDLRGVRLLILDKESSGSLTVKLNSYSPMHLLKLNRGGMSKCNTLAMDVVGCMLEQNTGTERSVSL